MRSRPHNGSRVSLQMKLLVAGLITCDIVCFIILAFCYNVSSSLLSYSLLRYSCFRTNVNVMLHYRNPYTLFRGLAVHTFNTVV